MTTQIDVCIEDFNGTAEYGYPVAYWADWNGAVVTFGGDWGDVPNMPAKTQPTVEQVHAWADAHIWPNWEPTDSGE